MKAGAIQQGTTVCIPLYCAVTKHSSTCCKLSGILTRLSTVNRITHGLAWGIIEAGCDSSVAWSLIQKWLRHWQTTHKLQAGVNVHLLLSEPSRNASPTSKSHESRSKHTLTLHIPQYMESCTWQWMMLPIQCIWKISGRPGSRPRYLSVRVQWWNSSSMAGR